jgi:hypothetical protein
VPTPSIRGKYGLHPRSAQPKSIQAVGTIRVETFITTEFIGLNKKIFAARG